MRLISTLFILLTAGGAAARNADGVPLRATEADIRHLCDELDTLVFALRYPVTEQGPAAAGVVLSRSVDLRAADSLLLSKERDEVGALHRASGLSFTGQAYKRIDVDGTPAGDEEDDPESAYQAKAQLMLGWNLFQSGLYQGRMKRRLIEQRNEELRTELYAEELERLRQEALEAIESAYAARLRGVLEQRLRIHEVMERYVAALVAERQLLPEELVRVLTERSAVAAQLGNWTFSEEAIVWNEADFCWVTAIDSVLLGVRIEESNPGLVAIRLRSRRLETEGALKNYGATVRLEPFVRGAYYFRSAAHANSTNLDAGLSFTLPITSSARREKRAIRAQIGLEQFRGEQLVETIRQRVRALVRDHRRTESSIAEQNAHRTRLLALLREQTEARRAHAHYNYIEQLEAYDTYLKSLASLYTLLLHRDRILVELQELAPDEPGRSYIQWIRLPAATPPKGRSGL